MTVTKMDFVTFFNFKMPNLIISEASLSVATALNMAGKPLIFNSPPDKQYLLHCGTFTGFRHPELNQ